MITQLAGDITTHCNKTVSLGDPREPPTLKLSTWNFGLMTNLSYPSKPLTSKLFCMKVWSYLFVWKPVQ